jgi:hypothetical protein
MRLRVLFGLIGLALSPPQLEKGTSGSFQKAAESHSVRKFEEDELC